MPTAYEGFLYEPYAQPHRCDQCGAGVWGYLLDAHPLTEIDPAEYLGANVPCLHYGVTQAEPDPPPFPTFIRLEGGELDLGIIRDTVAATADNDFQVFSESFDVLTYPAT